MQNELNARYHLVLPESMLNRIRDLSLMRKKRKVSNNTQKAIMLEFIEKGLATAEAEFITSNPLSNTV